MQIILERGKNQISFTGHDYYFLNKAHDMPIPRNVTINRAAHEGESESINLDRNLTVSLIVLDLLGTKWIGLITNT